MTKQNTLYFWHASLIAFNLLWMGWTLWMGTEQPLTSRRLSQGRRRFSDAAAPNGMPEMYNYSTSDGADCSVCYFPTVCVFHGVAFMAPESANAVWRYAENRFCGLKYNRSAPVNNRTLYSGDGLQIRFDKDLRNNSLQPLDILNLAQGNPMDIEYTYNTFVQHFPHYLEIIFLDVWRLLSYLTSVSRNEKFSRRFLEGDWVLNPTILIHDSDRRKQRGWFSGFHNIIQLTYPSVIFQDVSRWSKNDSVCYRSALVHRCDKPSSAFMKVFRPLAKRRLELNNVAVEASSPIRVGYLSRLNTRVIEDLDRIINQSTSLSAARGLRISSEKLLFEHIRFNKQIESMARTDILVGSHGAALANLFFLPAQSHVIEITPFGLPAYYEKLSQIGNVSYESIEARPDPKRIPYCAKQVGDVAFAAMFANASKEGSKRVPLYTTGARRYCLRLQNLRVDVDYLAQRIVDVASELARDRALGTTPYTPSSQ
jgi:hypothetical protein